MGGFTSGSSTLLPVDSAQKALAIDTQETVPDSVLNLYRSLIAWRQEYHDQCFKLSLLDDSGLVPGKTQNTDSDLLKIMVTFPKDEFIGVFNLSQTGYTTVLPDTLQILFSHNATPKTSSTSEWDIDASGWVIAVVRETAVLS
jgi:glycosidase